MLSVQSLQVTSSEMLHAVVERAALLKSMSHIQGVVERRNTIPILNNVRIDVEDGKMRLTATDMDIAMVEQISADVKQSGSTTVPAHMLYDIIRKLPDGAQIQLALDSKTNRISVQSGRSVFSLTCLPVDDFPVMEAGKFPASFSLSSAECAELLAKTSFAVSSEETRYYLNGIYLHVVRDGESALLRAVATDGHRLARMEVAMPAGAENMPGVILPRKTVAELKKLLGESDKPVQIEVAESKIRFSVGDIKLVSKLIDGTFPDYERVIPKENDKLLELEAKTLREAIDRVATIASDKSRAVKVHLKQGVLAVRADSNEQGEAVEELEVKYSSDPIDIGFNSRYLIEMLDQIEGDTVQFVFADATAPSVVRDTGNVGALYVVMPMRV